MTNYRSRLAASCQPVEPGVSRAIRTIFIRTAFGNSAAKDANRWQQALLVRNEGRTGLSEGIPADASGASVARGQELSNGVIDMQGEAWAPPGGCPGISSAYGR